MALRFNIPLIFYGEMPGEYGENIRTRPRPTPRPRVRPRPRAIHWITQPERMSGTSFLAGNRLAHLDEGMPLVELMSYLPAPVEQLHKRNIEFKYLGYYKKWVPQEAYYYAVENTGFEANPVRTEGTYSKYNSLDDKVTASSISHAGSSSALAGQ